MILVHLNENEQALGSKIDIPETFLDIAEKVRVVTWDIFVTFSNCSQMLSYVFWLRSPESPYPRQVMVQLQRRPEGAG